MAHASHLAGWNLFPIPDAEEYALLATRLAQFKAPLVGVGLHDYPSRYALAYPLLLVPFAWLFHFDVTQYFWASAFFGLAAVLLIARSGRWLLGSRLAGGVAAALFALHPMTIEVATANMSETALVMMFFLMLELARPWLTRGQGDAQLTDSGLPRSDPDGAAVFGVRQLAAALPGRSLLRCEPSLWRAGLLGLALGWLTIAKAPFAYWALALAVLVFARSFVRRRFMPFIALALAGLACALADALYRRWAFGAWGMNGYAYWFPSVYMEFLKTFHWRYLFTPWDATAPAGNLRYYGEMLLGRTPEFYSKYVALCAALGGAALAWPWRRGRPSRSEKKILGLMVGWLFIGFLFCGFYFFQSGRFPFLWIPAIDLAAAWGLVWITRWRPLRRGTLGRLKAPLLARVALLLCVALLLRGEYRRVRFADERAVATYAGLSFSRPSRTLLASVPEGAWVLTNFNLPLVEQCRATPGPTGSLYTTFLDNGYPLMNGHVFSVGTQGLEPRRRRFDVVRWLQKIPSAWENGPTELIGPDKRWNLAPGERLELFARPVYLLIVRPPFPPVTGQYLDSTVMPLLEKELWVKAVKRVGKVTLYRAGAGFKEARPAKNETRK